MNLMSEGSKRHYKLGSKPVPILDLVHPEVTVWTGTVFLGQQVEGVSVLLDTATDLTAFNAESCKTCTGPKVDIDEESFSIRNAKIDVSYGTQWITGREARGPLCFNNQETCANDFSFLYMTSQKVFGEGISGVIGLARPRSFLLAPNETVLRDHFFLEMA